ncbi:unnamed protein product [Pleuronectes platessa]|uniref:Uncharacterized protein n=1 Tax=Pleuronectes platessa TaxID=8262 RepID=A0A9N7TJD6_PLEPL|nr:unnamed protein product [Pleuronectes platessa]
MAEVGRDWPSTPEESDYNPELSSHICVQGKHDRPTDRSTLKRPTSAHGLNAAHSLLTFLPVNSQTAAAPQLVMVHWRRWAVADRVEPSRRPFTRVSDSGCSHLGTQTAVGPRMENMQSSHRKHLDGDTGQM